MISAIVSRLVILLFGTLYPAYASYKAVRTKNVKEYVKWMMYWIVFAFFTCIETFTDILLSWFPFYYEIKVIIVLWLLSPATRGSSTLYRKFVHPMLTRREQEIDDYINQAKEKGYTAVLQLGSKGVNYATNVIMQTAIKAFGTKAHTPVHGMMRLSQSDNSLLIAATAAASMAGHVAGPSRSAIRAREHHDEHDGGVGGGSIVASSPPYDSTVATLTRVRRSQSVDSALNRSTVVAEGRSTRSSTSRSVTRDGAATTINQHAIIYELDSEEEEAERFLAAETAYLLQDVVSDQRNVEGTAQRSRRAAAGRAAVTIAAAINADDSDDGGSTRSTVSVGGTSKVTKRKPTAQIGMERAKKKSNTRSAESAATTTGLTKSTTNTSTTTTTGTAARGRKKGGGGLVQTLRKSYSLSDLSEPDTQRTQDEVDEIVPRTQRVLRSKSSRSSSGNRQMDMYFPEVEIAGTPYQGAAAPPYNYIRSSDDISSGYSSAEPGLSRTASMSNTARPRLKSKTREDDYEIDDGRFDYYDREGNNSYAFGGGPPRASVYELPVNGSLPAITQAGETFIAQQRISAGAAPIYSNASQSQFEPSLANVPLEEREKYRKFLQWMKQQQRQEVTDRVEQVPKEHAEPKATEVVDVPTNAVEREENPTLLQVTDNELGESIKVSAPTGEVITERSQTVYDEFQDTISLSSNDEDEFQEVELIEQEVPSAEVTENKVPTENNVEVQESTADDSVASELPRSDAISKPVGDIDVVPTVVHQEASVIISEPTTTDENLPESADAPETPATDEKPVSDADKRMEEVPSSISTSETKSSLSELLAPVQEPPLPTLLECPATNLASSTSSLALSECSGSSGPVAQPRKHASFGKQRMAPPVPPLPVPPQPAPEMLVIRERSAVTKTTLATPPVAPSRGQSAERKPTNVVAGSSSSSPSVSPSDKTKSKKFMSSLTGMFKGHGGDGIGGNNRARDASPLPSSTTAGGHPRETQI